MRNGFLKSVFRKTLFRDGAVRTIRFGALRGAQYRCGPITGLAPFYSGGERDHQRMTLSILRAGDCAIDVGANWGMHTLLFSRRVGPSGRVLAVEPFITAREELEWHIRANQCDNVRVIPAALSDKDSTARFAATGSAYTGHLLAGNGAAVAGEVVSEIETLTLDRLLEREDLPNVRLVKLDVEGAESRVLRGTERTLREVRPFFVIELHTPEQDLAVAQILDEARYGIERVSGPPIRRLDRAWPDPEGVWGTIVARPK